MLDDSILKDVIAIVEEGSVEERVARLLISKGVTGQDLRQAGWPVCEVFVSGVSSRLSAHEGNYSTSDGYYTELLRDLRSCLRRSSKAKSLIKTGKAPTAE